PCPDKTSGASNPPNDSPNDGIEDFDTATGRCITDDPARLSAEGNLPWVTLNIGANDVWLQRFIYRVSRTFSDRPPGFPTFTITNTGNLAVCEVQGACPVARRLTTTAAAVILSLGRNQGQCGSGSCTDEAENTNNNNRYVSRVHTEPGSTAGEYDDVVVWLSPNVLVSRMVAAGRLP
ncbi:MAG: hypothetical protein ACREUA_11260, partial [Burkholderiales bacterium]